MWTLGLWRRDSLQDPLSERVFWGEKNKWKMKVVQTWASAGWESCNCVLNGQPWMISPPGGAQTVLSCKPVDLMNHVKASQGSPQPPSPSPSVFCIQNGQWQSQPLCFLARPSIHLFHSSSDFNSLLRYILWLWPDSPIILATNERAWQERNSSILMLLISGV